MSGLEERAEYSRDAYMAFNEGKGPFRLPPFRACYDYSVSPASYDHVSFLLWAAAQQKRTFAGQVEVLFAPGPYGGFRRDGMWPKSVAERRKMHDAVVLPMCGMLPNVKIENAELGPVQSQQILGLGRPFYGLKVFVAAIGAAGRCLRPKRIDEPRPKLVTITLRECEHWATRNSAKEQWLRAAHGLAERGFDVVFVRDTLRADLADMTFPINVEAACDLEARAAFYRSAFCNLFVSNGPAWFAIALDAPLLMFKPTTDELGACYSTGYFADCGLSKGKQLAGTPAHQRIVWEPDRGEVILREFDEFVVRTRKPR